MAERSGDESGVAERSGDKPGVSERSGDEPGPRVIGLTGNIGSGKSTVARLLAERGAEVIDADLLAREATHDPEVLERIAAELDPELVRDGGLDRERTARMVFADDDARRKLEALIHPWVRRRGRELQAQFQEREDPPPLIVHDIPLLFENGLESNFEGVLVVVAPAELRAQRVAERSGLPREEFERRDRAQWPLEAKAAKADWVVNNDGDLAALEAQVAGLWRLIVG
ncbi:MAG TPA: dephospho-CoA kinase [Trueperaceae bacterium]